MTTTPTASPELPDLDKLEALARAATPGRWMRLFGERTVYDRMEDGCRGNAIVRADLGYGLQDISNLDFIAGANPAAVLALIALARRAQPEGEAPQAALSRAATLMYDALNDAYQASMFDGEELKRVVRALSAYNLYRSSPAATLSPLCGAQHAESGKEAKPFKWPNGCDKTIPRALRYLANNPRPSGGEQPFNGAHLYQLAGEMEAAARALAAQQATPTPRVIGGQRWSKEAEMTEGWLAAQQAAAPGALELLNADELAALRRFVDTCQDGEGYDVPKTMMQRLAAIGAVRRTSGSYYETTDFGMRVLKQAAPSAPGTPEAPQTAAARDVLAERQRQVEQEGWTPAHDDAYVDGQLASAAVAYTQAYTPYLVPSSWPWAVEWFKAGDDRRNMVKAGALILAEIERLDRAAAPKGGA